MRPSWLLKTFVLLLILLVILSACKPDNQATQVAQEAQQSAGTAVSETIGSGKIVGISLPSDADPRWITDGEIMRSALTDYGYQVILKYANSKPQTQLNHLQEMVESGVSILIITPVQSDSLSPILKAAHESGVLIIGYDRPITKTTDVDFLVTFNHEEAGLLLARQIEQALGLADGKGPFSLEIFAGDPNDPNARAYYDASMSILQPYINQGALVVESQEIEFEQVTIEDWETVSAQARMNDLLFRYYARSPVDCILSPADSISQGVLASLRKAEYSTQSKPWPILTGLGAEVESVKALLAGEQTYTILLNNRTLAQKAAEMVHAVLQGQIVPVNNSITYYNEAKVVPAFEMLPVSVDLQNYQELLILSEYIKEDELGLP